MIGIHVRPGGTFDDRWINYCITNNIEYKIVNCYKNDFIEQMKGCNAFMWQFYQGNPKDILMAKGLMFSLEHAGIKTFPDFKSAWHFDDKVGQKYLLEAIGAPLAPSWVFYDKDEALDWADKAYFPKVFKLRGGGGALNVKLVHTKKQAVKLIRRAFGRGFAQYDSIGNIKERWRNYKNHKTTFIDVLKGLARMFIPPPYAKLKGPDKDYIYFQEFIPGNDHDIRIIVIKNKAFAIKRLVRENDFRASGSGFVFYERHLFDENTVKLSFDIAKKLQSQCVAFDFVYENGEPKVLEISYGFIPEVYDPCTGYWDDKLTWHEGQFDPYGWMVEGVLEETLSS